MSDKELHPDVKAFKQFVNKHPSLIIEIRKSGEPLQSYYERWSTNKKDPLWDAYKEPAQQDPKPKEKNTDLIDHLLNISKYVDLDKIQGYVSQFGEALKMVQSLLGEMNGNDSQNKNAEEKKRPINLFRD